MHPRRLLAVLGVVVLTSMTSCTSVFFFSELFHGQDRMDYSLLWSLSD